MRGSAEPRERFDLQPDDELISPPSLTTPHIACQERVHVKSFLPHADIEVRVRDAGGAVLAVAATTGGWPEPDGALVTLGFRLEEGQLVDARQTHNGRQSDWSVATSVLSIEATFPIGLPRPEINPGPTLDCGVRVGVSNLPIDFEVTVENSAHGAVGSGTVYRDGTCGYNVNPANSTGDEITAIARFCGEETERSAIVVTQPAPDPIPAPVVEETVVGAEQVAFSSIVNGGMVHVSLNGSSIGSHPCYGGRLILTLAAPLDLGDLVEATQSLCSDAPPSGNGSTTAQPCSALPAPIPASAQAGDVEIIILNPHPSGVVEVYADLEKIGENAGPRIALTRPLERGENVVLLSRVGACTSTYVWSIDAACVDPPLVSNPASINVYPVGWMEVGGDALRVGLDLPNEGYDNVRIRGLYYYPAATDGEGEATHGSFGAGSAPLALLIHGRHRTASPSYLGYRQLQAVLARQGIASLSVDHQDMQPAEVNDYDNIMARGRLAVYALALMAGDLTSLGSGFAPPPQASIIDFEHVGVMGHSRGGDAAVLLQHVVPTGGFTVANPAQILSVMPLAPTTFGTVDGSNDFRPDDVDVLVVLPVYDGDVDTNPGQKHYDLARVRRVRTQLLVGESNHNRYNTVWWDDHLTGAQFEDTHGWTVPLMSVHEHQALLTSYGASFFQRTLLNLAAPEVILTGRGKPSGVRADNVRMCHSLVPATVVDTFEDSDLTTNDLPAPNDIDTDFNATWLPSVDEPGLSPVSPMSVYYGETGRLRAFTFSPGSEFMRFTVGRAYPTTAEIWIRAAEDYVGGSVNTDPLEFFIGLEAGAGMEWVSSNGVGGMIPVVESPWSTRSTFVTFRFRLACFTDRDQEIGIEQITLRTNWDGDGRPYVFDDLEIVEGLP